MTQEPKDQVKKQIEEGVNLRKALAGDIELLVQIAYILVSAFSQGNKVLILGNGGSAADAEHFAGELGGKFYADREPLPAIALTTNTALLTAIANDYGFRDVFARQVRGLAKEGDVVIGISTSGNSPNVLKAMKQARECGAVTIGLTGRGGALGDYVDYLVSVPSSDTPRIQEIHLTICHILSYLVEEALFAENKNE